MYFLLKNQDTSTLHEDERTWPVVFEDEALRIRRRKRKGPTTSWIWSHGVLVSVTYHKGEKAGQTEDRWICCECTGYPSLHDNRSTSKPGGHLINDHELFDHKKELNDELSESSPIYSPDPNVYADLVVKFLAVNHLSFQLIETDEYKDLIRYLNPNAYERFPKSADWARSSALRLYNVQKLQIREIRRNLPYKPTISFDVWSSPNHLPMLAVIGHWYDGHSDSSCVLLGLRDIDGSHNGKNLAAVIEQVEEEYTIKSNDAIAHLGDNAANNGTTIDALGDIGRSTQARCSGHILNLGARELLNSLDNRAANDADETITGPISKIRQLAIHVNRSPLLYQLWKKHFKNNIARDNKTRWNSVLTMLDSVLKQTSCLHLTNFLNEIEIDIPMKAKLKELEIPQEEWNMLEEVQKFLKPFKECTMKLQGVISLFALADK